MSFVTLAKQFEQTKGGELLAKLEMPARSADKYLTNRTIASVPRTGALHPSHSNTGESRHGSYTFHLSTGLIALEHRTHYALAQANLEIEGTLFTYVSVHRTIASYPLRSDNGESRSVPDNYR
jgi:hypothetical protein